jgi:hypothetical protein
MTMDHPATIKGKAKGVVRRCPLRVPRSPGTSAQEERRALTPTALGAFVAAQPKSYSDNFSHKRKGLPVYDLERMQ